MVVASSLLAAVAMVGVVAPAHATTAEMQSLDATPLPGRMSAMILDPATAHVFVALGNTDSIAVLDYDGTLVTTIAGEAGAKGLVVVGDKLYVLAATAGTVDEIDTTTLTRTRTLVSGLTGVGDIVSAAGALWVGTMNYAAQVTLVRVSLVDGSTQSFPNLLFPYSTGLVADPADPNTVLSYPPGMSPLVLSRVDLTTTPPTVFGPVFETSPSLGHGEDFAFAPDGSTFVAATGAPYQFDELRLSDLRTDGVVYPANPYPVAVEIGDGLVVGGMDAVYGTGPRGVPAR